MSSASIGDLEEFSIDTSPIGNAPIKNQEPLPSVELVTVVSAYGARAQQFEDIERERSAKRRLANAAFAGVVRSALSSRQTTITEISRTLNLSRQQIHNILNEYGS